MKLKPTTKLIFKLIHSCPQPAGAGVTIIERIQKDTQPAGAGDTTRSLAPIVKRFASHQNPEGNKHNQQRFINLLARSAATQTTASVLCFLYQKNLIYTHHY